MINIKCGTPVSNDVQITHDNGKEIPGVIALDIKARPFEVITATLDINVNNINIKAQPLLSFETVQKMAEYYGYVLTLKSGQDHNIEPPEIEYVKDI